jgi:ferredoxin--NADP+ reductase
VSGPAGGEAADAAASRRRAGFEDLLAARGVVPVSYSDWLRVERAEAALGGELGRGARVKLPGREALDSICRPPVS